MSTGFHIVFEDKWLLVVHKAAGIPVHRSAWGDRHRISLVERVSSAIGRRCYPAHRLDRATSGLVILTRNRETAASAAALFQNRQVGKTYQALVRGFCAKTGILDRPLKRRRTGRVVTSDAPPQPSETRFRTLRRFELPVCSDRYPTSRLSLLELQPLTGRWHQIRRHLNHAAHPVIGDTWHGDNTQNHFFRKNYGLDRMMLAATELQFRHPETAEPMHLMSDPDPTFQSFVEQLKPFEIPAGGESTR